MNVFARLPIYNITRLKLKSFVLIFLVSVLAFSAFGGILVTMSLQSGMEQLNRRLGADIMVVPDEAAESSGLENIVLQGNTGYFYMDRSKLNEVAAAEGIDEITPQIFLASASAGCCSAKVQIMGFDPDTDFVISPWIRENLGKPLESGEVIVGSDITADPGEIIRFYDVHCTVVGKLKKTGTHYDVCAFASNDTMIEFIKGSLGKSLNKYMDIDPDKVISCILINVKKGYSIDDIVNEINLRVDGVTAVRTTSMISGISQGLLSISNVIGLLIAAVWLLSFVIMILAFTMTINERRKEFAVLRVIGVSSKKLSATLMKEVLMTGLSGGIVGVLFGTLIVVPFSDLIRVQLDMPMLLPGFPSIMLYAVTSLAAAIAAGALASAFTVRRISRIDAGALLREE